MRALRPFSLFLFAFLCLSCAAPVPRPPESELERRWQAHATALAPLANWELRGRLAVRSDARGGQASLSWRREAARHSIRLNGPLGRGVVRVTQDEQGARLTDAERREFEAASAEELLYLYTGWQLPIASLDWWVRGLPAPGLDVQRDLDESGRLKTLHQQGWQVQYEEYMRLGALDLPNRLTFRHAARDGRPAIEVRLVIERWLQVK
jgi:outer membrane lipoprotein LolB